MTATFLAALLGASALTPVAMAAPPVQQNVQDFNIAPQPLQSALLEFSRQSQSPVVASTSLLSGLNAPAVEGRMEETQALNTLLAGSGLYALRGSDGGWAISRKADADPQGGSAAGSGAEVEALIVTAQKREEDIQDVPIAISAFSQEALERSQIAGGPDLITQVPNMTFTKTNFASYSIQIRGIGTQAVSATTDPGVAVAFNNTPFIRNRFFEQEFYDLQRVEVLRGPQGTLYGRNATGGVVNIISAKPKFHFEAKASGDLANYNSMRLEGMVNIPLVEDAVALRLAGAWTKRDGYAFNEITGAPIDGRDLWSTRLSLRFAPTDRIDANLIWEHFEEDDDRLRSGKQLCKKHVVTEVGGIPVAFNQPLLNAGQGSVALASIQPRFSQGCERNSLYSPDSFQTPNGASVPYYGPLTAIGGMANFYDPYASQVQSRDLRVIESTVNPQYRARSDLAELQISFDLTDALTLTSETAYSADFVYSLQDFNRFNTVPHAFGFGPNAGLGTTVARGIVDANRVFCDPQIGCSDRLVLVDVSTAKTRNFSQEFRVGSDFDGPFNFSLGANFLRYDTEDKYYVFINHLTLAAANGNVSGSGQDPLVPYVSGQSDNKECMWSGFATRDPALTLGYNCVYIELNSIAGIEDRGHNYFLSKNPYKLISYAVFGETYYNVTENLKVTAGLRWTVDKKHAPRIPSWTFGGQSAGYPVLEVIDREWREPTGRLAIDWKPDFAWTDETLLYASYAHGYKAGGANPPPMGAVSGSQFGSTTASTTRPKTFEAEFVDAFELGAKNTLADGAVTLNLAAFYYDYKDYQVSEIIDRSAFNHNFDATVWGIEIEADWRPLENLRFGFKGGYEKTRIADGERAIDLMDRTAGVEGWSVVRPFPTFASSCILPTWLFTPPLSAVPVDLGAAGGANISGCDMAYLGHHDPVTNLPYVPNPTVAGDSTVVFALWPTPGTPGAYPGWDPLDESQGHNHGEGFFKQLGGNELPNAPNFTATLTADYTVPLAGDWLATLHTDLYWQSQSWWRVFNDHEYGRLDEYFNVNLAAIFANEDAGWRVMAYVKNVFDRDSITGAFLLSDDTSLVTNVFLTEPRLYGLRVTKAWSGGPLLGGFGARREGPYPFTLELGGQVQNHEAPYEPLRPSFMDALPATLDPTSQQNRDLDWGDGREARLTWRPGGAWSASAGVRYGQTNSDKAFIRMEEDDAAYFCSIGTSCEGFIKSPLVKWSDSTLEQREDHVLADFKVGVDVGLGVLGIDQSSVGLGLRYAKLNSETSFYIDSIPDWYVRHDQIKYPTDTHHHHYSATLDAERKFEGVGPVLSWDAAKRLLGNDEAGHVDLDWSLGGGVLFGKQKTSIEGVELADYVEGANYFGNKVRPTNATPVNIQRSDSVTTPVVDLSVGLSYKIDRMTIGAGYRWERYFDALDVGDDDAKEADRTIDGPYFKLSVGFGG